MRRGIIHIDDNYAEFGIMPSTRDNIRIYYDGGVVWGISYEKLKEYLGFDYLHGLYVIGKDSNEGNFPLGREMFPYNLDHHTYNAKFEEHLFAGKQHIQNLIDFRFINELPYTFGLEFETAGGFLAQHRLYELGLIPLRDGSISGIEYTTVVLQGNMGLNFLKQQLEELNERTIFDKDCSLHVHFGNFKLTGNVLLAVNNLFANSDIRHYLPELTFDTHLYKTNQNKNYCTFNNKYRCFEDLYQNLVDRNFYGDFCQPHPRDPSGTRKWNVSSRYKAVNLINAVCYEGPKTIEFRMLRPTYNFEKILGWLFIYGAIIKYAEQPNAKNMSFYRGSISIVSMIKAVYSPELAAILCDFLAMSHNIVQTQYSIGDRYGMRVDIDDKIINYKSFGHYFY